MLGDLISAGGSLLGGIFGGGQKRPRYEPYARALVGPGTYDKKPLSLSQAEAFHQSNMFAGRVADAKKNDIHPLFALGVQPFHTPPMQVGGGDSGSNLGAALSNAGQDLGRAYNAYKSKPERQLAETSAKLAVENQSLQNDLLRSQIARVHQQSNPSYPGGDNFIPGQGLSTQISKVPVNHVGIRDDMVPIHTIAYGQNKRPIRVYNEDLGDNELAQAAHFLRYTGPDYIHGGMQDLRDSISRQFKKLKNYKLTKF